MAGLRIGERWIPVPLPLPSPEVVCGRVLHPALQTPLVPGLSRMFSPPHFFQAPPDMRARARRIAKARRGTARTPPVRLHDVKQPAPQPPAAQPVSFPRRVCAPGVLSPVRFISAFSLSPPHLRSVLPLGRAKPVARRQRQVPPQNEGQAERREAQCLNVSRSLRRDVTLARREPSRATGTPPLGAPPWRCRPGDPLRLRRCRRRRGEGAPPAIGHGGLRPRRFESAVTSRVRRHPPLRLQDRLRKTPPHERGCESISRLRYVVNTEVIK